MAISFLPGSFSSLLQRYHYEQRGAYMCGREDNKKQAKRPKRSSTSNPSSWESGARPLEKYANEPLKVEIGSEQDCKVTMRKPGKEEESEELRMKGKAAEKDGDWKLARERYRGCVMCWADNGKGWIDWAKLEVRYGRGRGEAIRVLRQGVRLSPKNVYLWLGLGKHLTKTKRYKEARECFQTGRAVDATCGALYSAWGALEAEVADLSKARELFEMAISVDNEDAPKFYHMWGMTELHLGNKGRAIELWNLGLRADPENSYIWQSLGTTAQRDGNYDYARRCYERVLQKDENNVVVMERWGRLEAKVGNNDMARRLFAQGAKVSNDSRICYAWASFELQLGFLEQAQELIVHALKRTPNDAILWHCLARITERKEDYPRARALFKRAIETDPKNWLIWDSWSAMEHKLGNTTASEKLLSRSFALRYNAQGEFSVLTNSVDDNPNKYG